MSRLKAIASEKGGRTNMRSPIAIRFKDVHAWYGESHVLHGINLEVCKGEVVSLLGRNGAGRTTSLRALMGLVQRRTGAIEVNGIKTQQLAPHRIARLGVGYCPEERGILASLSCEENLLLPPKVADGGMSVEEIYNLFPNLKARRASPGGRLSGGEQQMLAVARILRSGAQILLLDEISEGLAPVIVQALAEMICELRNRGFTILIVEQNFHFAAPLADRFYIMECGLIRQEFSRAELNSEADIQKYLSI